MKYFLAIFLLTAACSSAPKKDYDAIARCQEQGHKPGNADFDECVKEEKASKILKQQRDEFERIKREEQDNRLRRY